MAAMPPNMLTLSQVSEETGYEQSWLRRQVYAGNLKAQLYGKTWVVSRAAVDAFMALERPPGRRSLGAGRRGSPPPLSEAVGE